MAVLTNTGWVSDFLKGQELGTTAAAEATVQPASADAQDAKVYFQPAAAHSGTGQESIVVLPDGRIAKAVFQAEGEMIPASATVHVR